MNAITFPNQTEFERFKTLTVSVIDPPSEAEARTHLTSIRLAGKRLDGDVKALKAPYQAAIKDIDTAAKPWKDLLAERDQALTRELLAYGQRVRIAAELANKKILEKYESKVDRATVKAIEKGTPIPIILPPQTVSAPPNSIETEGAKQTIVKRKNWRIPGGDKDAFEYSRNSSLTKNIPDEFFVLDTGRIGKIVRAGGSVPGIEVFEEESISVRAI
jgi:hypothetical protein